MTLIPILFIALTILACVSPALTFLSLWQIKEWRIDRLTEHLRQEGWMAQLLGSVRPLLLIVVGCIVFLALAVESRLLPFVTLLFPLSFSLVGLAQYNSRKQRLPVWTSKTLILLGITFFLITSLTYALIAPLGSAPSVQSVLALVIPLLVPAISFIAWLLFFPVDLLAKMRIIKKAENMRASQKHLKVIGITGSVGKTTTKELLAHILKSHGALATPLHVNSEIGVAKWLIATLRKEPIDSERILIVEMGAYRMGEIALLARIAQPTIGVITAAGSQHMALFGSTENIIKGKGELFAALPKDGHAFGNKDTAAFTVLKERCLCPLTSVGTDKGADLTALDIEETASGIRFKADQTLYSIPMYGTHTVTSILLAIAVSRHLGLSMEEISMSLRTFKGLERTFEMKTIKGITVLDDTYNLSPESFRASIEWAAKQKHTQKILVTEGIIELGTEDERVHSELAQTAASIFDRIYVTQARLLPYFQKSSGDKVHLINDAKPLLSGDLLVCAGRLPNTTIRRFLPV